MKAAVSAIVLLIVCVSTATYAAVKFAQVDLLLSFVPVLSIPVICVSLWRLINSK